MKNFKNRVLSGVMAGILAVSMAVPAFAQSTELTGAYVPPTIEVVVPATGDVVVNPFGMPVTLGAGLAGDVSIVGSQIVTKPLAITNIGKTDLKVSASVTAEAKGDLRLVTSKPSSSDVNKSAYVYLQMTNSTLDGSISWTPSTKTWQATDLNDAYGAWAKKDYSSSTDLLLSGTAAASKNNMLTLKAAATVSNNQVPVVGSAGFFRLAGLVTTSPREAWTTDDGFTATVAFTFAPDFTAASIDKETATVKAAAGTDHTADLTVSLEGATIVSVEWASDAEAKATVEAAATPADGTKATVTGVAAGTANVTATITASNGLTYTATCVVTVE